MVVPEQRQIIYFSDSSWLSRTVISSFVPELILFLIQPGTMLTFLFFFSFSAILHHCLMLTEAWILIPAPPLNALWVYARHFPSQNRNFLISKMRDSIS